jgi:hypothetical protein
MVLFGYVLADPERVLTIAAIAVATEVIAAFSSDIAETAQENTIIKGDVADLVWKLKWNGSNKVVT